MAWILYGSSLFLCRHFGLSPVFVVFTKCPYEGQQCQQKGLFCLKNQGNIAVCSHISMFATFWAHNVVSLNCLWRTLDVFLVTGFFFFFFFKLAWQQRYRLSSEKLQPNQPQLNQTHLSNVAESLLFFSVMRGKTWLRRGQSKYKSWVHSQDFRTSCRLTNRVISPRASWNSFL